MEERVGKKKIEEEKNNGIIKRWLNVVKSREGGIIIVHPAKVHRDPKSVSFLNAAITYGARYIVTLRRGSRIKGWQRVDVDRVGEN